MECAAAIMIGAVGLAVWIGPWRLDLLGASLSVRNIWRPVTIAAVLLVARWFAARGSTTRLAEFSDAAARVVAGALVAAGLLAWVTHQSPYLGGADSYGYVSAAERIRDGALIQREPLAPLLPYANAIDVATPLGYVRSARVSDASVPSYPLGLPMLMALATAIAGARGPFLVSFAMGIVLIAICGWMVFRWTRNATIALAATAAVLFHPVVFAYAIQPMSDVPAAAFYLIAGALLLRSSAREGAVPTTGVALAGAAAGFAVLIRPALLPAAAALALVPMVSGEGRARRVTVFAAVLALFVAAQMSLQWYLYGSPLASGYGGAGELFALRHLPANARSYGYWMVAVHGIVWFAGLLAGLTLSQTAATRALLLAAFIGAIVPYSIYRTYDHWETLRFVLPFLIIATLVVVTGLFDASRKLLPRVGSWIALALVLLMIGTWARWLEHKNVLQLALVEVRFSQAGELVARATPANAVVLASLHSGSVRYYAKRATVDWAKIPAGQMDRTITALSRQGMPVFVLIDGEEERAEFVARHGDVINQQQWLPSGQRRDVRLFEAPRR